MKKIIKQIVLTLLFSYTLFSCHSDKNIEVLESANTSEKTVIEKNNLKRKHNHKIFFYDKERGEAEYYSLSEENTLGSLIYKNNNFRKTWDIISSYNMENHTYQLFYDKQNNELEIYELNENGSIKQRTFKTTSFKNIDKILVYNKSFTKYIFLYSSSGIGQIHKLNTDGTIGKRIQYLNSFRKSWHTILTYGGNFVRYMFFYDKENGDGEIYAISTEGLARRVQGSSDYRKTWDKILIYAEPSGFYSSKWNILFYDKENGDGEIYELSEKGLGKRIKKLSNYRKSWNKILHYNVGSSYYALFYDKENGDGEIYTISEKGSVDKLVQRLSNYRKSWDIIKVIK